MTTKTDHGATAGAAAPAEARRALFADRNFRWLAAGSLVSMLGDQFTNVALPWLVLKMTGDPLALGGVMAAMSVPRALFMLIGGALTDRHSPKRVLMLTKLASLVLLTALGVLALNDALTLPLAYVFAVGLGLATAFSIPSGTSLMPQAVPPALLAGANGLLMAVRQVSMFAGPLLAGLLIACFGDRVAGTVQDGRGLALAFLADAASFALSAWTLSRVTLLAASVGMKRAPSGMRSSIAEGLRYCWNDRGLRACLLYWSAVALFVSGPLQLALPLLAERVGGAAAFGSLVGAHGAGTLAGMLFSGVKPGIRIRNFGTTLLLVDGAVGLLLMPLGAADSVWQGIGLLLAIGLLAGFLQVAVYTWLQRRIAPPMMGRGMALFMFVFLGLGPLSAAAAGWTMRFMTLPQLFAGAGMLLVLLAGSAFALSRLPELGDAGG